VCFALLAPTAALARPPEVATELAQAQMLGSARYQVLAWQVFEAQLWSQHQSFDWDRPFALSLTYRRAISVDQLVSRSVEGMAARTRLSSQQRLAAELRTCFADVSPGDRITGVSLSENTARFYLNGRQRCEISWPGFRRAFFGIWLDATGSDRTFSAQLRGAART
jgi:Chalcone isomerase-like